MSTYHLHRSDMFFLAEKLEVIFHLPDFLLAEQRPENVLISFGDEEMHLRVSGMGNQQGKLAVRLAAVDRDSFVHLLDASQREEFRLSA